MPGTRHYFSTSASVTTSASENTLPASWYSSEELYEFERRAIFSKRWLLMSHKSRLTQTGDWLRYSFASYDIIVTRDRTGAINSFHNVCRHRAYPVIEKEGAGNSKILACRYHGWSYGLNGKLAKAPGYQEMNLDKDANSLFRCHTKIDRNGFIWINMDAKTDPTIPFEEHFSDVDAQNEDFNINFDDYLFDSELRREDLQFNWKNGTIDTAPAIIRQELSTPSTGYFPITSSTVTTKALVIQKLLPQASNRTMKHYELYRHKDCPEEEWNIISDAYVSASKEEKATQVATVFIQTLVRDAIKEHHRQEKAIGREIWPSRPVAPGSADQIDEDEEICAGLACGPQKEVLAW